MAEGTDMPDAVIVDVVRTASGRGKPGGALSATHPVDLLAMVLEALVERNSLDPALIDDVIGGCVTQSGEQSINVTRSAVMAACFPDAVPATTIDRQCGSSQQAAHFAAQGVMAGVYDVVVACGVESMSRTRMYSSIQGRDPYGERLGTRFPDGPVSQGISAELVAQRWGLDRDLLDAFALRSHQRATEATTSGQFDRELVPIDVRGPDGALVRHGVDETIDRKSVE